MSIHANLKPEALDTLHKQKRFSTIASLVVSVLLVTLIALVLGIFLLPTLVKETPVIVTYSANTPEETKVAVKKVQTNPARKPSAPSSSMARVIAANTASPVSIPVPEITPDVPSVDFGSGDDFGAGVDGSGFGAKDSIQPSGWMAAYHGRIAAPESGRYRFRAASDDFLVALVDGRRNLVACWPDLQAELLDNFKPGAQQGSTKSPLGDAQLHAGEWISMRAGQQIEISLAIGERPGGMVGFLLEVEKEGETYRTAADGRKILPLFTTHPFTDAERNEIQGRFGGYEFEWEKVPVFGIR